MDIKNLGGTGKELTAQVGDNEEDTITLRYNVGALTPRFIKNLRDKAVSTEGGDATFAMVDSLDVVVSSVSAVLISWDLTADGEPYPTTVDALEDLGIVILGAVWVAIQEDAAGASKVDDAGNA